MRDILIFICVEFCYALGLKAAFSSLPSPCEMRDAFKPLPLHIIWFCSSHKSYPKVNQHWMKWGRKLLMLCNPQVQTLSQVSPLAKSRSITSLQVVCLDRWCEPTALTAVIVSSTWVKHAGTFQTEESSYCSSFCYCWLNNLLKSKYFTWSRKLSDKERININAANINI